MWDIVWVSPQGHRSVSVSSHFLLQAPQCPCSVRKRFSRDHCYRGRSKPCCRIVGSHTRWELTTWADFQLCLHRLLMSTGCKSSHNDFLDVSRSNGGLRISGWIGQLSCLTVDNDKLQQNVWDDSLQNAMPHHISESKVDCRCTVVVQWISRLADIRTHKTKRRRCIDGLVVQPPHLQQHTRFLSSPCTYLTTDMHGDMTSMCLGRCAVVSRTVTFPDRRFPDKTFPGQMIPGQDVFEAPFYSRWRSASTVWLSASNAA